MELEIRHLRVVCAVADNGSLSRAAATLRLSQPALTRQVRRIERIVGGELFLRGANGVTPTKLGEFVLTRAHAVLPAMDELQRELTSDAADDGQRTIRLGEYPAPLLTGITRRLRELISAPLRMQTENSSALLGELVGAGILAGATVMDYPRYALPIAPRVDSYVIAIEPGFVALPADHPLAALPEVDLAALREETWFTAPANDFGDTEAFLGACERAGFAPRAIHHVSLRSYILAIEAGDGVGVCQGITPRLGNIAIRPMVGTPLWFRHLLLWDRRGPLADVAERLCEFADAAYAEAEARGAAYGDWIARHPRMADVRERGPLRADAS
jgi:DNA-binding transcriptional LysR family regulator